MSAPSRARVGVLALQGDVAEHAAMLERLGVEVVAVRTPAQLATVEGLVLPGGESTTLSMLLEWSGLREPLAERLAAGMPAFGTCAGLILLSAELQDGRPDQHCFGAIALTTRRNAFGRQLESFEADLMITGVDGPPMHAVFIRAPVVERVGPGVEVLATVDLADGSTRAVVCRQGRVLVAAFHPELASDSRLHELFLSFLAPGVAAGDRDVGPRAHARQ